MSIKKIYLLYHCENIYLPHIPLSNEFSEKNIFGLGGSVLGVFLLEEGQ